MKPAIYPLLFIILLACAASTDLTGQELVWEKVPLPATVGKECFQNQHSRFSTWIHPVGNGDIYISAGPMALYRSTDGGATWHHTGTGIYGSDVTRLVEGGRGELVATTQRGVFSSIDGGEQWTLLFKTQDGWPLAAEDGDLYVLDRQQSVYHHRYGSATWAILDTVAERRYQPIRYESGAIDSSGVLYIERYIKHKGPELLRSTDKGRSWSQLPLPRDKKEWGIVHANGKGDLFISTDEQLWRSTNSGASWTNLSVTIEGYLRFYGIGSDGVIYADYYRSTDNGKSWERIERDTSKRDRPARVVAIDRGGRIYAVAENGELFRAKGTNALSAAGAARRSSAGRRLERSLSWVRLSTPHWEKALAELDPLFDYKVDGSLLMAGKGSALFAGRRRFGLFRTTDLGKRWDHIVVKDENGKSEKEKHPVITINAIHDGILYAVSSKGDLYHSEDNGETWEHILHRSSPYPLVSMSDGSLWSVSSDSILILPRGGSQWEHMVPPGRLRTLPVIDSGGVIYTRVKESKRMMLARSSDRGVSWTQTLLPEHIEDIHFAISPRGRLYAPASGNIFVSRDRGESWEMLTPANGHRYGCFAINTRGSIVLPAEFERFPDSSAVTGIRISHDDGHTWRIGAQVFGMREHPIHCAFDEEGYLYVMTNQGGIYRSSGSTFDTTTIAVPDDGMHVDGLRAPVFDREKVERAIEYPPFLQELSQSGKAHVAVLVGENGAIKKIESRGTTVEFEAAASRAAEASTYTPALRDGKPVEAWLSFIADFGPQEQNGYDKFEYKKPNATWQPIVRVLPDPTGGGLWWGPGEWDRMTMNNKRFLATDREPSWDERELERNTIYPLNRVLTRSEGAVCVQMVIGPDGEIVKPYGHTLDFDNKLTDAAVEAVKRTRFTPASRNGVPVASGVTVVVSFELGDTKAFGAALDTTLFKKRIEDARGDDDGMLYGGFTAEIAVGADGRGRLIWMNGYPKRLEATLGALLEAAPFTPARIGETPTVDTIFIEADFQVVEAQGKGAFTGSLQAYSIGARGEVSQYARWRRKNIEGGDFVLDVRERKKDTQQGSGLDQFTSVEQMPTWDEAELARKIVYPADARAAGVDGIVVVRVYIDSTGRPSTGKVDMSASPMLNDAALSAIDRMIFTPATQNGKPVGVWVQVPVVFKLDGE